MTAIRLGIIGFNEGNGHPFSYAAIFNGYDPIELERRCPFSLIKEYLPREHGNRVFIDSAKVTHVWTQDRTISEDIAKVALIPHIADHYTDLIGHVDAVILARDDPWNHLPIAEPFVKEGVPLFIDKQLTSTEEDLNAFLRLAGPDYLLMAGSSVRFSGELARARTALRRDGVKSVHGVSRQTWMRYGHHLFEGVACLWGLDIEWVRSLSEGPDHDIVQIRYASGPNVILEFIRDVALPIQFTCYSESEPAYRVPFEGFFYSFREMLTSFVRMVVTRVRPIPLDEIVGIARVVLAGDVSKQLGGAAVSPITLMAVPSVGSGD